MKIAAALVMKRNPENSDRKWLLMVHHVEIINVSPGRSQILRFHTSSWHLSTSLEKAKNLICMSMSWCGCHVHSHWGLAWKLIFAFVTRGHCSQIYSQGQEHNTTNYKVGKFRCKMSIFWYKVSDSSLHLQIILIIILGAVASRNFIKMVCQN